MSVQEQERPRTQELQRIRISKLSAHPFQPRKGYDPDTLAGIRSTIRANVVGDKAEFPADLAITVRETMNGYLIISGHTRTEAARLEGLFWVWAYVKTYKSDEEAALDVIMANNQKELRIDEVGLHAKNMKLHHGWSHLTYAERTGRQYNYVKAAVRLHELSERFSYMEDRLKRIPPTTLLKVLDIEREQQSVTERLTEEALRYTVELEPTGKMLEQIVKLVNQGMEVRDAFDLIFSQRINGDQVTVVQAKPAAETYGSTPDRTTLKNAQKAVSTANKLVKDSQETIQRLTTRNQELEQENQDLRSRVQDLERELAELREMAGLDAE